MRERSVWLGVACHVCVNHLQIWQYIKRAEVGEQLLSCPLQFFLYDA